MTVQTARSPHCVALTAYSFLGSPKSTREDAATNTIVPSAAFGILENSGVRNVRAAMTTTAATAPATGVLAPADALMAEREKPPVTGKETKKDAATFVMPNAQSSWFGAKGDSLFFCLNTCPIEMDSMYEMSATTRAPRKIEAVKPTWSAKDEWKGERGMAGVGREAGTEPMVLRGDVEASRSNKTVADVATITTKSCTGKRFTVGRNFLNARRKAAQTTDMTTAETLASATLAMTSGTISRSPPRGTLICRMCFSWSSMMIEAAADVKAEMSVWDRNCERSPPKRKSAKTDCKRPDVSARVTAACTYVGFSELTKGVSASATRSEVMAEAAIDSWPLRPRMP